MSYKVGDVIKVNSVGTIRYIVVKWRGPNINDSGLPGWEGIPVGTNGNRLWGHWGYDKDILEMSALEKLALEAP